MMSIGSSLIRSDVVNDGPSKDRTHGRLARSQIQDPKAHFQCPEVHQPSLQDDCRLLQPQRPAAPSVRHSSSDERILPKSVRLTAESERIAP